MEKAPDASAATVKGLQTLQDFVPLSVARGDKTAISWQSECGTERFSYTELAQKITAYSKALLELGLQPGDKVALLSSNNPQWIGISLGINNAGMIDVPRADNVSEDELEYILGHSESKLVFVENEALFEMAKTYFPAEKIISFTKISGATSLTEFEKIGRNSKQKLPKVSPDQTAAIIYTSGTTGRPKGVELTHGNFASNIEAGIKRLKITREDKFLSILPADHALERFLKYCAINSGAESFYSTLKTLRKDFKAQSPTVLCAVPRIWQLLYEVVMKTMSAQEGAKVGFDNMDCEKAKAILNEALGGNFRYGLSGGSALPKHVEVFFFRVDNKICTGYGTTEASPVISVQEADSQVLQTVGPPLEGLEAKILDAETGEELPQGQEGLLYVRGPNIMKGYYKDPEATASVLDSDGWYNTRDVAYFDKDGDIVISGRQDEMFKSIHGEKIHPNLLEAELVKSPYISLAMVIGEDSWKRLGAYLVPDFEVLEQYCNDNGMAFDQETILKNKEIRQLYKNEIDKCNKTFKDYEAIRTFRLVKNLLLTKTLKLRRSKTNEKYSELYEEIKAECS
ncbi:MAG: AMP-binding protein [Planctomycetes bacterium]|nr:AMP-binding protein [Planctomycetota bacterium]